MASQTITLKAQIINLLGPSPAQTWGNSTKWGSPTTWAMKKVSTTGIPALNRGITKTWSKSNVITPLYSNSSEYKGDGRGYFYQFIDSVSNKESAAAATSFLSASSYLGVGL